MIINSDIAKKIIDYAANKKCIIDEEPKAYIGIWHNGRRIAKIHNNSVAVNSGILNYIKIEYTLRSMRQHGTPNVCDIMIYYKNVQITELYQIIDASIELASKYYFTGNTENSEKLREELLTYGVEECGASREDTNRYIETKGKDGYTGLYFPKLILGIFGMKICKEKRIPKFFIRVNLKYLSECLKNKLIDKKLLISRMYDDKADYYIYSEQEMEEAKEIIKESIDYAKNHQSYNKKFKSIPNLKIKLNDSIISSHKTSRVPNPRLRLLVMKRDKFKCVMCGKAPANHLDVELHIDHITPWSKGGETILENLQTLCSVCNLGKGDLILE